ncbi:hypothetical protein ACJDU8_15640 [Clostridium sp. WILCCON 0269]|uniref:Uncharacterized protein n=1 Tax=Candidatus Clostridium eludens TaxID=3381663 RepID=A0ABW8SQM6_9CLOT
MIVNKKKLKDKINVVVDKLVDSAEREGDLNFFEINIKHTNGDLSINLMNKYKEKL